MSLSKKLGAYSVTAGAVAMGVAGVAKAELQIYDHRAAPLTPEVELWDPGTPDDLVVLRMDGSAKYKLTAGGGGAYNYYDENHDLTTPIDGTDKSGDAVWFMYETYPDPSAGYYKDGVVFHTEAPNGVHGYAYGSSRRPYLLTENDVVDASLDYYTDGTGLSIFGFGSGGNGHYDDYGYGEHYLGFFMDELDGRHYGWVHIDQPYLRVSTSILGWAYQDEADAAALVAYPPPPPGDFDLDGDVDDADIDLLGDFIRGSLPYDLLYDVSGPGEDGVPDGFVDINDLNYHVHVLVETSIGTGTEYSDFNLDGKIDNTDLTRLAANYSNADWNWDDGNANRHIDTNIDNTDLTILATYYGFGGPDVIPEPMTLSILALGASGVLARRRR